MSKKNSILNYFKPRPPPSDKGDGGEPDNKLSSPEAATIRSPAQQPKPSFKATTPLSAKKGVLSVATADNSSKKRLRSPVTASAKEDDDEDDRSKRQKKEEEPSDESHTAVPSTPSSTPKAWRPPSSIAAANGHFPHQELPFLQPGQLCDKEGRRPDVDEDYDPTSLRVPRSFVEKQTPAQSQWWNLKSENFDTLLLFKMGKFYELFHMDAVIAVQVCGLLFMKSKAYAHCGFPEVGFQKYAGILVEAGYKVARIEQVETPKMMDERCKSMVRPTKFDKVVKRKVCEKVTLGTRTMNSEEANDDFLVAICDEKKSCTQPKVGVCVLNASLCKLFVGEFVDDSQLSKTYTILTLIGGAEIIFSKSTTSAKMQKLIQGIQSIRKSAVKMPDVQKVLDMIRDKGYFLGDKENSSDSNVPKALESILGCEGISSESYLSASAFSLVAACLNDALIDERVLSFKEVFELKELSSSLSSDGKSMVMLGQTLKNLDVLPTEDNHYMNIFTLVNHTSSAFGRRMLKHWVCNPLLSVSEIVDRQEAIATLHDMPDSVATAKKIMKKMCDFEKRLTWIFAACLKREDHPDDEAIMYSAEMNSAKAVGFLISCLKSFQSACTVLSDLIPKVQSSNSRLLKSMLKESELQELEATCQAFRETINYEEAVATNKVIPASGLDPNYDEAAEALVQLEREAEAYRKEVSNFFGEKIVYFGSGPNCYQLEVPDKAKKRATIEYMMSSSRKGYTRYTTKRVEDLRDKRQEAEQRLRQVLNDVNRRTFREFYSYKTIWQKYTNVLSKLDCLMSLQQYSYGLAEEYSAFPKLTENGKPCIRVKNGMHPLLFQFRSNIIPNDVDLDERVFVLTGANMGGKSTVMRSTATLVILAQLGCKVPAEEMSMTTTVDRLFSRMGARDNILEGQSTFLVELLEMDNVLKHATHRSLALIDELGRGTSTHDGAAIAQAVIEHFAEEPTATCRIMFTTHYHQVTENFANNEKIRLFHMAMLEPKEDRPLTFLYKLVPGVCPRSYGFNAALSAGVYPEIVARARKAAQKLQERMTIAREFFEVFGRLSV